MARLDYSVANRRGLRVKRESSLKVRVIYAVEQCLR